ncbi:dihydrofolate reductase family protein [Nocardia sp. NPDC055321]
MRKLVYYVGVTLDGCIAGPGGEFDFYPVSADMQDWMNERYPEVVPTHLRAAVGMAIDTPNRVMDTVIMGRGSYDPAYLHGITSPYAHMRQYVISRTLGELDDPAVSVVAEDPVGLVRGLKREAGLDIYLCGGGALAGALSGEIDELIVKSYPVLAGGGIPMVGGAFGPAGFRVTERREFDNGAQVTWYSRA